MQSVRYASMDVSEAWNMEFYLNKFLLNFSKSEKKILGKYFWVFLIKIKNKPSKDFVYPNRAKDELENEKKNKAISSEFYFIFFKNNVLIL